MDLRLTDEQQTVTELAATILGDAGHDGWPDTRTWRALADAGLLGIALPAEVGGAGLGLLGAHLVLAEVGGTAAEVPYWETIVLGALPLAAFAAAEQRALLDDVVAGRLLLTAALTEESPADPVRPATTAVPDGDHWRLTGTKTLVPVAAHADRILASAATDDGRTGLFLLDGAGVELEPQRTTSDVPHARLTLTDAPATAVGPVDPGGTVLAWLLPRAVSGICSLQAGACAAALALAATYTSERRQFGRPIATFQAVRQRVADAYIDTEACRLTALQAAWRLTEGLPSGPEVAIAAWWAAEAGHRVLHAAHHVHGGIGVDRGYPLHRYFLRTKQYEFTLGTATDHLRVLGATLAAEPA